MVSVREKLPGYPRGLAVYEASSCVHNESSWRAAAVNLGCTLEIKKPWKNIYYCIPNQAKSRLVEFCYDQQSSGTLKGVCQELNDNGFLQDSNCTHFEKGCPDEKYLTETIYNYKSCLLINTEKRCYLAEDDCPPHPSDLSTRTTTFNVNVTEPGFSDASNTTLSAISDVSNLTKSTPWFSTEVLANTTSLNDSDIPNTTSILVPVIIGVIIVLLLIFGIWIWKRRGKRLSDMIYDYICLRNTKTDAQTNVEDTNKNSKIHESDEETSPMIMIDTIIHPEVHESDEETSLKRVKGALIHPKVQEEVHDQEAEKILETTKEILLNHKSSETYVRTGQIDTVKRRLLHQHIVLLTGIPGDGKSTAAKQVMCELSENKEYVPAIITEPSEWKKVVNSKQKMILHVDDMFGSTNLDTGVIDKWKRLFDLMKSSATDGRILILITSRTSIIAEVRKLCHERFLIDPECQLDLTCNVLTSKEKEQMLLQYEKVKTYKASELEGDRFREYEELHGNNAVYYLPYSEHYKIVNSEPYYGFPQTCFLFFVRKDFFQLGADFFLRSHRTLFENIDNMRKSTDVRTKMRYSTLAYVFLEGNIHILGVKRDIFQEICEKAWLQKWTDVDIEDAVHDLEGIYLSPSNQTNVFTFCHVTIREAVAASFGKLAPDIVIKKCSHEIVRELIRTEVYEARDGEVILTIRKKYYPLLANRLLTEDIKHSLCHPATDDAEFTQVLFDVINNSPCNSRTITEKLWNTLVDDKPLLYRGLLTFYGPHHIKHIAQFDSDISVDEHDINTSLGRPFLITREQVKDRLGFLLCVGHKQGVIVIIRYVISNCDVNYFLNSFYRYFRDIRGMSVLHYCVSRGWMDVVDEIVNVVTPTKTEDNWSCLHFAAFFARFELFKKFQKLSSNVLETTREGYNILQMVLLGLKYGMRKSNFPVFSVSASTFVEFFDTSKHEIDVFNILPHVMTGHTSLITSIDMPRETGFINILKHVMTGYPSLITSIDMPLDDYSNNIFHYLVIHDRLEIYDILVEKKKDLIFHRNDTDLPSTLHVAAYLGRLKFVEKLWKAGVCVREKDISIAKCIESGQENSDRTVTYEFSDEIRNYQWKNQQGKVLNNIKLNCIPDQSVRFGSTKDYIAISSICIADNLA